MPRWILNISWSVFIFLRKVLCFQTIKASSNSVKRSSITFIIFSRQEADQYHELVFNHLLLNNFVIDYFFQRHLHLVDHKSPVSYIPGRALSIVSFLFIL